jgi:isopenicillin-N epimerase
MRNAELFGHEPEASVSEIDWAAARRRMILDPTVTMLNTGSFGPLPEPVFDRATELRRRLAAGPTDFFVRQMPPLLWEARERTAAFLGTVPQRLAFTSNISAAINLVASGLRLAAPGEILMSDHEYGAMIWCWERAAQRQGLTIRTFKLPTMATDPGEIVAAATKVMTPRTRLFFFSHVLSPTGLVLPAKELCAEARRRGIVTVVDGAHAPVYVPLNVSDVNADFYGANLHKWLLAPSGAGFLVIGPGNEDRLQPLHVSWGYHPDKYPLGEAVKPGSAGDRPRSSAAEPMPSAGPDARDAYGSTPRTRFLEFEGTRDPAPWLAVPAAIDFQAQYGFDNVRGRIAELAAYTRKVIGAGGVGLPLATPATPGMSGAMTAFELPAAASAPKWRKELWARRVEIPVIERPDRLLLRVSHHFYTTESEIDRLAEVLREVL